MAVQFYLNNLFNRYTYTGPIFAITELDGTRITSAEVCDLIQKVPGEVSIPWSAHACRHSDHRPASSVSIFRPGSTSPSAILFDAWESFTRRSPKADESIRSIRPDLAAAVDECIDAAGQEWEPQWQRRLLSVSLLSLSSRG
jgi:hypothetical protein